MEQDQAVSSVRCRFITNSPSIRVSVDPLSIPIKLGRKGLTDVINHLLGGDNNRAYDFLVYSSNYDGTDAQTPKRLLRKSLRAHFEETGISTEHLITVEYFLSLPRPSDGGQFSSEDWIGSVTGVINSRSPNNMFVSGSYDGLLNVVSGEMEVVGKASAHDGAVKSVCNCGDIIVSGGQDKVLRTWKLVIDSSDNHVVLAPMGIGESTNRSHESSVECSSIQKGQDDTSLILSGDWDGRLCMWKTGEESSSSSSKKQKTSVGNNQSLQILSPVETWKSHAHCVSEVRWSGVEKAVTASWDHSIKLWEVERQDCISTINTSKVNTCMDVNGDLVVSGHPHGTLRLWDIREEASSSTMIFGELNTGWIAGVAWSPVMDNIFAATSHDGSLSVFDVRTTRPLFNIKAHGSKQSVEKGLCVAWSRGQVASGGTDKQLKTFNFSDM